jgi:hypothetical protein
MKYPWNKMSDTQKASAIKEEMKLDTHNGTTKDDLLNMLQWLLEEAKEDIK